MKCLTKNLIKLCRHQNEWQKYSLIDLLVSLNDSKMSAGLQIFNFIICWCGCGCIGAAICATRIANITINTIESCKLYKLCTITY